MKKELNYDEIRICNRESRINQYILEPDSYRSTCIIDILIYGED